jgi:hypothetical protein
LRHRRDPRNLREALVERPAHSCSAESRCPRPPENAVTDSPFSCLRHSLRGFGLRNVITFAGGFSTHTLSAGCPRRGKTPRISAGAVHSPGRYRTPPANRRYQHPAAARGSGREIGRGPVGFPPAGRPPPGLLTLGGLRGFAGKPECFREWPVTPVSPVRRGPRGY